MKNFFISYNKADSDWANWIAWQLEEEAGQSIILQDWDFRPGSNFVLNMNQAMSNSERTIAVLSPDYLTSNFTPAEWAAAFAKDPRGEKGLLLPIRIRDCEPQGLLPQIVYIDLLNVDESRAKELLLAGIQRVRAKPTCPPRFPSPRKISEQPLFPGALSAYLKKIEEDFLRCKEDQYARSRRKSIAELLVELNKLPLGDFDSLNLKARILLQASLEARSYREIQKFSLEIGSIYEVIFQMEITQDKRFIAVRDFVNWAIDYSQLCGHSVGLYKIVAQLNNGITRIGQFIGLNVEINRGRSSELLALRAKAKRAQATLLQKRRSSGQKQIAEINSLRKDALADAHKAYELCDSSITKHELALCLFANTSTMDSNEGIRGLELLKLANKEGSNTVAYELTRQLRMRHQYEEAIDVFKSVARIDNDRRRFHANVSLFAYAVIGIYYKNKGEKEKYMQDAQCARQWLKEVIKYDHHTAIDIINYCQLKLICGVSESESLAELDSLKPMSDMAWNELIELAIKAASGDDSTICESLLLGLEDASVWSRIGTIYSDFTTQFKKAIEFYDRAILIDNNCPVYHYNKAVTFAYKLHDYESARNSMKEMKNLREFSWAWYKLNKEAFADLKAEIQKHLDG
jgi:tetratricopeptide (TPR) repeat protein